MFLDNQDHETNEMFDQAVTGMATLAAIIIAIVLVANQIH